MSKSLFFRMFIIYLIIAIISLSLLGIMMSDIFRSRYLEQKRDNMLKGVKQITNLAEQRYMGRLSDTSFLYQLATKSRELEAVLWLADEKGTNWVMSDDDTQQIMDNPNIANIIREMYSEAMNSKTVQYISVMPDTKQPYLLLATPLTINNETAGVIFMNANLTSLYISLQDIYRQIVLSALLSASVVFVLVYLLSSYISRDIRKITYAARQISKGNYNSRVDVRSKTEIGELALTFNRMAEDLERLEGLRTTFVANVSHELRTPMTSIQGFVQGILDGAISDSEKDVYLNTVVMETKRLNKLISDLLELSKVESGKFPLNIIPFDINELLCQCLITFESSIEDKKIEVDINLEGEKLMVNADPDRITQVLTNLMDNAVKFTPDNGILKLTTSIIPEQKKVCIMISDNGSGIPESEVPYIFERFYKVDKSHARKRPGYGIGLSIVKRIIEQHSEKIWIVSKQDMGAAFYFTLQKQ